jgi:acyl-CoA thioesterase-1
MPVRAILKKVSLVGPVLRTGRDPLGEQALLGKPLRTFFVFLAFLAALLPASAAPTETKTILFFGDSLTAGYGLADPESEAYPALIQKKLREQNIAARVVNAGLSGETTSGGLRRLDWVLRQPVDVFVLALGGNDMLRGIDPALARDNLQRIIDRVRAKFPRARILLAGMSAPPSMGTDYVNAFRAIYPPLAEKNKIALLPFLLEDVAAIPELNQPDGIHPTAKGHAIIADHVWKALLPLL